MAYTKKWRKKTQRKYPYMRLGNRLSIIMSFSARDNINMFVINNKYVYILHTLSVNTDIGSRQLCPSIYGVTTIQTIKKAFVLYFSLTVLVLVPRGRKNNKNKNTLVLAY